MNAKRLTNVELVVAVMTKNPYPETACTFVVTMMLAYCEGVIETGKAELKKQFDESGTSNMINSDAWFDACVEMKEKLDKAEGMTCPQLVKLVSDVMNFSRYGAFVQMIAITALHHYSQRVQEVGDDEIQQLIDVEDDSTPAEWRCVAADIMAKLEARKS